MRRREEEGRERRYVQTLADPGYGNRQTADTFDAAATFFDLTREWGEPEPDVLQRIKFSKWNAARILKAIREGKDPNESNPQPRAADDEDAQLDAEADALAAELTQHTPQAAPPRAAAVEDVMDAGEPLGGSASAAAASSVHEGYFPPGAPADVQIPPVQPPPPSGPSLSTGSQIPPQPSPQIPTKITPALDPHFSSTPSTSTPPLPPANIPSAGPPPQPSFPTGPPAPPSAPSPAAAYPPPAVPVVQPAPPPVPPVTMTTASVKDINQAQKHAKFAISALNFDDVPTAINELRTALATLGAQ
jgi:vacuolar protein sorting-associated protein VTA1